MKGCKWLFLLYLLIILVGIAVAVTIFVLVYNYIDSGQLMRDTLGGMYCEIQSKTKQADQKCCSKIQS